MVKTRSIVLHSIKYGESKMIVDLFTQQHGRVSFIVSIPKTSKAKVKKQFFQPLSILEIEFDFRMNVPLQRLKDVRLAVPFSSIPFDPFKLSIGMFVAEFLLYSTKSEQENLPLYTYMENSIAWLDGAEGTIANFHLIFMMQLSRFLGFFPNIDDYVKGELFDLREGQFVEMTPVHRDFLDAAESAEILNLMRLNYHTMHLLKMSRIQRNRCAEVIIHYYRLHIPSFPELKSFSILKELFV